MSCRILVSVHDVAPSTFDQSRRLLEHAEAAGMVTTLLVVAGPWNGPRADEDERFGEWLRSAAAQGHEVASHGWDHRRIDDSDGPSSFARRLVGTVAARGCDEFWLLGDREARRRLRRSVDVLQRIGLRPTGFTPPGWLASPGTVRAARGVGLQYRASHRGVHDLCTDRWITAPALSSRPGSLVTESAARLVETLAKTQLNGGGTVRLALHPDDLADRRIMRSLSSVMDEARRVDASSSTYQRIVTHVRQTAAAVHAAAQLSRFVGA